MTDFLAQISKSFYDFWFVIGRVTAEFIAWSQLLHRR
jgi:hypothetical protein